MTLGKLVKKFEGTDYLIELYGYADSTASSNYNLALSQKRIDSVKLFLNNIEGINFNYFEKNLGEEEQYSETRDLALSRRVDIFVIPVRDNKIVIRDENAEVAVPMDYFEPCGACQSQPKIDAYYTVEEAAAENMVFETTNGIELVTAGTFSFNLTPCSEGERKSPTEPNCFTVFSNAIDTKMTLWEPDTLNGMIYWKSVTISPIFDTINNTYSFCTFLPKFNIDRPKFIDDYVNSPQTYYFPIELNGLRSEFWQDDKTNQKSLEDTVKRTMRSFKFLRSHGQIGNTIYHFKRTPQEVPITDTLFKALGDLSVPISCQHIIGLENYEKLTFLDSDTTLVVKLRNKPIQVGYYLRDVHQFIPFESNKKNQRFYGQKPTGEYELAYMKKRDRVYVLPTNKMKLKYKRFRKVYKLKFRRKHTKWFKRDKEYTPKKAEWDEFLGIGK